MDATSSPAAPEDATPSVSSAEDLDLSNTDTNGIDGEGSGVGAGQGDVLDTAGTIKKKKKKRKTPGQKKAAQVEAARKLEAEEAKNVLPTPAMSVLKISRNKHMKVGYCHNWTWRGSRKLNAFPSCLVVFLVYLVLSCKFSSGVSIFRFVTDVQNSNTKFLPAGTLASTSTRSTRHPLPSEL